MMLSLRKSQRISLLWLVCALAFLNASSGHAEVASVYGGPDGRCGSRTANGKRVNCAAMMAAHRTLPFGAEVRVFPPYWGRVDHRNELTATSDYGLLLPAVAGNK